MGHNRAFFIAKTQKWFKHTYEGMELNVDKNPEQYCEYLKIETVFCDKCLRQFSVDPDYKPVEWRLVALKSWIQNHTCCNAEVKVDKKDSSHIQDSSCLSTESHSIDTSQET